MTDEVERGGNGQGDDRLLCFYDGWGVWLRRDGLLLGRAAVVSGAKVFQ